MKRVTLISAGFLLMMVGIASAEGESKKVRLSYTKSRSVLKLTWPIKLTNGSYSFQNPSSIYGNDVSIKAKKQRGRSRSLAINLNYDGSSKSKTKLYKSKPIIFNISGTLGEKKVNLPLVLDKIFTSRSGEIFVKKYPGWAMKGAFGKASIYLIDANVDGQFDTSGQDYIAIGSTNAVKLRKQTSIGGKFYNLSVTSDGSELTLEEVKPENLCKVTLVKGFRGWGVLALSSNEGTYNIAAKNCDILPAGEYKIDYGLYARGANSLYLRTQRSFNPQLDIRKNNINTINIGAPFSLNFTAKIKGETVIVESNVSIVGRYGETYRFNSSSKRKLAAPSLTVYAGKKRLHASKMGFG